MRVLLALFLLSLLFTGNVTKADVWCVNDYDVVWKSKKGSCGWKNQKIPMPSNIDLTKGPTKIVDDMIFYSELKNETITNEKNNTKVSASNQTINNDELKEQLKYWKSLLEDELISQEDYNYKKNELLNFEINSTDTEIKPLNENAIPKKKINIAILEPSASDKCYKENNIIPWVDIQNLEAELNNVFSNSNDFDFTFLDKTKHPQVSKEGDWDNNSKWEGLDNYLIINTLTKENCLHAFYEIRTVSSYFRTDIKHQEKKFLHTEMKKFEDKDGHYSKNLAKRIYKNFKTQLSGNINYKFGDSFERWLASGMNTDIHGYFNSSQINNYSVSKSSNTSNSTSSSNNNLASELDGLMNNSNSQSINSNTNSSPNPCSYVRMGSNVCNKKYAEIKTWSDTRLCMNLEDVFFVETEELYLETARLRNIVCKNGRAYDSGTSSNIVNSFEPEDYETNCYKKLYTNKVTCKTKKIDNSTRELVGDLIGEILNQID